MLTILGKNKMDLFQFFLGVAFLIAGTIFITKTRDKKKIVLGLLLITIGLSLIFGGVGLEK